MCIMKKYFVAVVCLVIYGSSQALEISGTVNEIFSDQDTVFYVRCSWNPSQWLTVRESVVGPGNMDRIHSQLLDALVMNKPVWIGASDAQWTSPRVGATYDVWATTITK
jgi:hypothetical protein